jgi:hypothetical protein
MAATKIGRSVLLAFGLLLLAIAANAAPVSYVLGTPGVV